MSARVGLCSVCQPQAHLHPATVTFAFAPRIPQVDDELFMLSLFGSSRSGGRH